MTQLSDSEIADVCRKAGFGRPDLTTAIACALAASNGIASFEHAVYPGPVAIYKGLWGIDECELPALIGEDLTNPYRAAQVAYALSEGGGGFAWCPAYRARAHLAFMDRARACEQRMPQRVPAVTPIALYAHRRTVAAALTRYAAVHDAVRRHPSNGGN